MSVKTERITILSTPSFKAFLTKEAKREGVSVSEYVRNRCLKPNSTEEEQLLAELIVQVRASTDKARQSLEKGISDAEQVLSELRRA